MLYHFSQFHPDNLLHPYVIIGGAFFLAVGLAEHASNHWFK